MLLRTFRSSAILGWGRTHIFRVTFYVRVTRDSVIQFLREIERLPLAVTRRTIIFYPNILRRYYWLRKITVTVISFKYSVSFLPPCQHQTVRSKLGRKHTYDSADNSFCVVVCTIKNATLKITSVLTLKELLGLKLVLMVLSNCNCVKKYKRLQYKGWTKVFANHIIWHFNHGFHGYTYYNKYIYTTISNIIIPV